MFSNTLADFSVKGWERYSRSWPWGCNLTFNFFFKYYGNNERHQTRLGAFCTRHHPEMQNREGNSSEEKLKSYLFTDGDWSSGRLKDRSRFHPSLSSGGCYGFSQPLVPNLRGTKLSPHSLGVIGTVSNHVSGVLVQVPCRGVHGCTLVHILR